MEAMPSAPHVHQCSPHSRLPPHSTWFCILRQIHNVSASTICFCLHDHFSFDAITSIWYKDRDVPTRQPALLTRRLERLRGNTKEVCVAGLETSKVHRSLLCWDSDQVDPHGYNIFEGEVLGLRMASILWKMFIV